MRRPSVFDLPAYRVGPYSVRAHPATRGMFSDRRRVAEVDWNGGTLLLNADLSATDTLRYYLRSLFGAIHYRSGLMAGPHSEEAFTQSAATGLIELATNNRGYWVELNQLLEAYFCPGAGWADAARGAVAASPLPRFVRVGANQCCIETMTARDGTDAGFYGFYWLDGSAHSIQVCETLDGTHLQLILVHEVLHFLHACANVNTKSVEPYRMRETQAALFARLLMQNPQFWRYWCAAVAADAA